MGSQSVCTYRAVGPATNRRSVLANCQENTRTGLRGVLGFDSRAENAIEKATDTFIPGKFAEMYGSSNTWPMECSVVTAAHL